MPPHPPSRDSMHVDSIPFYAGALLCAAVCARTLAGAIGILRERSATRRRADADAREFRHEAEAAAVAARARLSRGLAWEGRRSLRVAGLVEESPDVKSFFLTSPDGKPLPSFLPGQYLTVALPVEEQGAPVVRCYSLSDRPRGDYYRLSVKRQAGPEDDPTVPPGVASNWLHDHVRVGDHLECEAPKGVFFHEPDSERPVVLIGAGVGATPIVSILAALDHVRSSKRVYALLGYRDGEHCLFRDQLEQIAERNDLFSVRIAYSRPAESDVLGLHYHHHGRLSIDWLRDVLPSNNFEFYLCGPPRMMQTLVPDLLAWGAPDDAIHYEAFGPASVSLEASPDIKQRALGSKVLFAGKGDDPVLWDGAYETLLDLAEARGVPIASGCRAGNCGACRVRVVEGSTTTLKRPGAPLGDGECLACISMPDGQVLIEA